MSRLVAYLGNDPERLACALFPARGALHTSLNGRRCAFGLGFVQAGDVLLQKRPRSADSDIDFFAQAKDLRADALIGRVSTEDADAPAENIDPFRFRSWLFASLGRVLGFDGVREKLLESVPDYLLRNLRGNSASEHLFHL